MSDRMNYRQPNRRAAAAVHQRPAPAHEAVWGAPRQEGGLDCFPVAMTYTPWQRWGETYPAEKGLERGTIFPVLDKPFAGRRC